MTVMTRRAHAAQMEELFTVLMKAQTTDGGYNPFAWKVVFQTMLRQRKFVAEVFAQDTAVSEGVRDLCRWFYESAPGGGMRDICRRCRDVFWPRMRTVEDPIAVAREKARAEVAARAAARAAEIRRAEAIAHLLDLLHQGCADKWMNYIQENADLFRDVFLEDRAFAAVIQDTVEEIGGPQARSISLLCSAA